MSSRIHELLLWWWSGPLKFGDGVIRPESRYRSFDAEASELAEDAPYELIESELHCKLVAGKASRRGIRLAKFAAYHSATSLQVFAVSGREGTMKKRIQEPNLNYCDMTRQFERAPALGRWPLSSHVGRRGRQNLPSDGLLRLELREYKIEMESRG